MKKILIASDVHGSAHYAQKLIKAFYQNECDCLVLLGDIYNHGPRNPFPCDYDPMKVAETLNNFQHKLIVLQGNCDSEVDQMISTFKFQKSKRLKLSSRTIYLTHGHKHNADNLPKNLKNGDWLFHGHTHVCVHEVLQNGVHVFNPGSVSLPKDDKRGYLVLQPNQVTRILFNGETEVIPL